MYPFEDLHTEIKTNQIHIEASKPHQQENFTGLDKERERKRKGKKRIQDRSSNN